MISGCLLSNAKRRRQDAYRFAGFRSLATVQGVFGDPKARVITLNRRAKNSLRRVREATFGLVRPATTARARSLLRRSRVWLDIEVRHAAYRHCDKVKRERLDFPADNPFYTRRFACYVGRRCVSATIKDVVKELRLDWYTVKELEKQYMAAQLAKAGTPGPKAISIDEISIRTGHTYRIVVSGLHRGRPIWFGGEDRSESSMAQFYDWPGKKKSERLRLAMTGMWKPFRTVTNGRAPKAAILFDKFHVLRHLNEALDQVRKHEYARLTGKQRHYIKG